MANEEVFNASQDTFVMCKGVKAVLESTAALSKYLRPLLVSKFGFGHPIRYRVWLRSALDDMEHLVSNLDSFRDPLYAATLERTKNEFVGTYYMIAEGATPVNVIEQTIIAVLSCCECRTFPRSYSD